MFEPRDRPRVFGVPPGTDFPKLLVERLIAYHAGRSPDELARVRILVNTRRMQRRISSLFAEAGPLLLPRIGLVTEVDRILPTLDLPPAVAPLRRRLEMAELVKALIDHDPTLAPRAAAIDLADSLARLLDEMQGEGVPVEALDAIDVGDESAHWARSLAFLKVTGTYLDSISGHGMDAEARRRLAIETLCDAWRRTPPTYPVIVAGSTGSRAPTAELMRTVAGLPFGAVVLPGFDQDLPDKIWSSLLSRPGSDDHPQYRFATLLHSMGLSPGDVLPLGSPPDPARNLLISLSLRPAHVSDQWLSEGPELGDLLSATSGLSLIEAPQPADEAGAIAVALREAVHQGRTAALITPDLMLGRRVAAAMERWDIVPDNSAGVPLSLTASGRFLRQTARLIAEPVPAADLIALLKHPFTGAGPERGPHMLAAQSLEVALRRKSIAFVTSKVVGSLAESAGLTEAWTTWLSGVLDTLALAPPRHLTGLAALHVSLSETIASGSGGHPPVVWDEATGRAARAVIDTFLAETSFNGDIALFDYRRLLDKALAAESARELDRAHTGVMIWGTLEARVQGAERVILGGLNEGVWPEQPSPDPWLNRRMRAALGLLLPEREIGLAAHDYQQAAAAPEVVLSRAARTEESETVPSRWLNRLTNLLSGLPEQNGPEALRRMRARGDVFLSQSAALDLPTVSRVEASRRPCPAPPVAARPTRYSVTELRTLVLDPYAVYARRILRLNPLPPFLTRPDARMKGIVFHEIFERFFALDADFGDPDGAAKRLRDIAEDRLSHNVPMPAVRQHWWGQLAENSDWLIDGELRRMARSTGVAREVRGSFVLPGPPVEIVGKADRIDRLRDGELVIYDYKTGSPPDAKDIRNFDRQLLVEAVMAEGGGFPGVDPDIVAEIVHIGTGRSPKEASILLHGIDTPDFTTADVLRELVDLVSAYGQAETGFASRRGMDFVPYDGDYDHLARVGEWDPSKPTLAEPIG